MRYENGARVCGIRECTYVDVHPISYDNDVMHYEGEDKRENRFSTITWNSLDNGGIDCDKEANFDKNFKKGKRIIKDLCFVIGLNDNIRDIATARFLTILRITTQEKKEGEARSQIEEGE